MVLCGSADSRGSKDNVEYHSWSRLFHFAIKVRDFDFWNMPDVKEKLKEALVFMSGDRAYHFTNLDIQRLQWARLIRKRFKLNHNKIRR